MNNKTIHKLKEWRGIFWVPICSNRMGSDKYRVTTRNDFVTCDKCLVLLGD